MRRDETGVLGFATKLHIFSPGSSCSLEHSNHDSTDYNFQLLYKSERGISFDDCNENITAEKKTGKFHRAKQKGTTQNQHYSNNEQNVLSTKRL